MSAATCSISRMLIGPQTLAGSDLPRAVGSHAARCLRCQAEIAQSKALRRELAALGHLTYTAPPGLEGAVLAGMGPSPSSREVVPPWAPAVAASVVVASALVWWVLRRSVVAGQTA
jgi:hypothetical protein